MAEPTSCLWKSSLSVSCLESQPRLVWNAKTLFSLRVGKIGSSFLYLVYLDGHLQGTVLWTPKCKYCSCCCYAPHIFRFFVLALSVCFSLCFSRCLFYLCTHHTASQPNYNSGAWLYFLQHMHPSPKGLPKWPGSSSRATKRKGLTFTNPSRKRHPLLTSTVAWRFVCWHIKDVVCMWTWRAFDSTFLLGEIKLPLPFSNNSCGRTEQEFHHNSLHWASQSWCWTISSSSSTT